MAEYKCDCNDDVVEKTNVTIRFIDGEALHDVKCSCGKYLNLIEKERNYTKDGIASLGRMNKNGSSY